MKYFLVFLLVVCAPMLPTRGDGVDTITAEDLAFQLGVRSWVSKIRLQEHRYTLQVFHVVNGKVTGEALLGGAGIPTDRDFTRMVILVSPTAKGTRLSLQTAAGAPTVFEYEDTIPLNTVFPLPRELKAGDYILGGDIPYEAFKDKLQSEGKYDDIQQSIVGILKDIKNGLLFRVTRQD